MLYWFALPLDFLSLSTPSSSVVGGSFYFLSGSEKPRTSGNKGVKKEKGKRRWWWWKSRGVCPLNREKLTYTRALTWDNLSRSEILRGRGVGGLFSFTKLQEKDPPRVYRRGGQRNKRISESIAATERSSQVEKSRNYVFICTLITNKGKVVRASRCNHGAGAMMSWENELRFKIIYFKSILRGKQQWRMQTSLRHKE